ISGIGTQALRPSMSLFRGVARPDSMPSSPQHFANAAQLNSLMRINRYAGVGTPLSWAPPIRLHGMMFSRSIRFGFRARRFP
ncbi:MAG: hypothetical protein ABI440_14370, partial [Casimicrobiaceae bacterium]